MTRREVVRMIPIRRVLNITFLRVRAQFPPVMAEYAVFRQSSVTSGKGRQCKGRVGRLYREIGQYGRRGTELGINANYLGDTSRLKDVENSLSQGDVGRHLTRIHQDIHKVYSK